MRIKALHDDRNQFGMHEGPDYSRHLASNKRKPEEGTYKTVIKQGPKLYFECMGSASLTATSEEYLSLATTLRVVALRLSS